MFVNILKFNIRTECYNPYKEWYNTILIDSEKCEVGEIINDKWLVLSLPTFYGEEPIRYYTKGQYALIIDINFIDVFESDMIYDHPKLERILNPKRRMNKYIIIGN